MIWSPTEYGSPEYSDKVPTWPSEEPTAEGNSRVYESDLLAAAGSLLQAMSTLRSFRAKREVCQRAWAPPCSFRSSQVEKEASQPA